MNPNGADAPMGAGSSSSTSGELTLRQAQALVDAWMRERGWTYWHPLAQLARMTEELGELARLVNHLFGEKPKKVDEPQQELALEMADIFYTMICFANSQGIDIQTALEQVLEKYGSRDSGRYNVSPE